MIGDVLISEIGFISSSLGIVLYLLANLSYSIAVFTDPGSPRTTRNRGNGDRYSHLPTTELPEHTSFTVSSTGGTRYCKKCQCAKPDRAHHCSGCKRCVLKMDHHCPWLATCVGLHNYKPFLLFLIYTSLFCWMCLAVTSHWVWAEILTDSQYLNVTMPVNVVLLAVIAGIIGLVLTGFTAWHLSLAYRGMTTIECLEKTRYLSPLRKSLDRERAGRHPGANHWPGSYADHGIGHTLQGFGQQVLDSHANAIPGVTRAEEGEERPSPTLQSRDLSHNYQNTYPNGLHEQQQTPAQQSLYNSYEEMERVRERERYDDYLDDRDGEKLPHAFDLGWRRNLRHLFGERAIFWFLPVCNTTGDGWRWDASSKWLEARERIRRERGAREHQQPQSSPMYGTGRQFYDQPQQRNNWPSDRFEYGNSRNSGRPDTGVSMKTLRPMSPRLGPGASDMDNDDEFSGDDIELSPEDEERRALNPSVGALN